MAVHLAANPIVIGDRVIQRCFVCGFKLCDNKGVVAPVNADGSAPRFPTFEVGALVNVSEGDGVTGFSVVGQSDRPSFEQEWDDCCLRFVEA